MCNVEYQDKVYNLTLKLNAMEKNLKKSFRAVNDFNTTYLDQYNCCVNNIAKVDNDSV